MQPRTVLLLVEGPHDLEFCARLLKPAGFSRVQSCAALKRDHGFWQRTVPTHWPQADDLLARHPVPLFLANPSGQSAAIVSAAGIDRLAKRLRLTLANLDALPDGVAVILDADETTVPLDRFGALCAELSRVKDSAGRELQWPSTPGTTRIGPPRTGIFILPDNQSQGTLEDLLIDGAKCVYSQLLRAADDYVTSAARGSALLQDELEEFHRPSGRKKATVAAMASVLNPGRSIQVSIQDNRWLEDAALDLPRIRVLREFLETFLR